MRIFNPANIVISLIILAAIVALVIIAIRRIIRWIAVPPRREGDKE